METYEPVRVIPVWLLFISYITFLFKKNWLFEARDMHFELSAKT